jgi:hypothetical protein
VLVYGDHAMFGDGAGQAAPADVETVQGHCPSGDVRRDFLRGCWLISPGQALIRTAALRRVGGFDRGVWGSDDWDLYIRLAGHGRFVHRRRLALYYRRHEHNASRDAVRHVRNHLKVMAKHHGLDVGLMAAHLRAAAPYFVPNLLGHAHRCRQDRCFGQAAAACLYSLLFQPSLACRRHYLGALAGALLRRPPQVQSSTSPAT